MRAVLRDTVPIGTSLTNIFTVHSLAVGVYAFRLELDCIHVGTPTAFTLTTGFSGTASAVNYTYRRFTASGLAVANQTSFAATASSVWISADGHGLFIVTAPGNLSIGCTRTGGTSSTIQRGGFLDVEENAC